MEAIRKELATGLHEAIQGLEVLAYAKLHAWFVHLRDSNVEPETRTEHKEFWAKLEVHRTKEGSFSLDEAERMECRAILECLAQIGGAVGPGKTL